MHTEFIAVKRETLAEIRHARLAGKRLIAVGTTSARTIESLRTFCEKHLAGRYELQVIDVYQQPELARTEQIVAVPTLIKKLPLPLRRLIGDMSDEARVLVGLDILPHQ